MSLTVGLLQPTPPRSSRASLWGIALGSFLLFLLLWTLLARSGRISPISLTGPDRVAAFLWGMVRTGKLWVHLRASASNFLPGYGVAGVVGVVVGLLLGTHRRLELIFGPYIMALNAAPRVAFIMLILAWFGIGGFARNLLVFLGVFFPVCVNCIAGAKHVEPTLVAAGRVFGATRSEMFWKITVPAAVPYIFTGLQLGVGRGLVGLFLAESYGAQEGIGFLITQAGYLFRVDQLFGGLVVLAVFSLAMSETLRVIGNRLTLWYEGGSP